MATSSIPLPANFVAGITNQLGQLFSDFAPYIVLVISIVAIALLIEVFINAIRPK